MLEVSFLLLFHSHALEWGLGGIPRPLAPSFGIPDPRSVGFNRSDRFGSEGPGRPERRGNRY